MSKILSIIPARGGSKRIPNKDIISFQGEPMIYWTIEAAKKSKFINSIYVSSEDQNILKISKKITDLL